LPVASATAQSAADVGADMDAVVAKGKAENAVVWYTSPGFRETLKEPLAKWAAAYPEIEVQIVEMSGSAAVERVKAEQASGTVVADVLTVGDSSMYLESDLFSAMHSEVLPNMARLSPRLSAFVDEGKRYVPTTLFVYGIGVNTGRLSEEDRPKSWKDLISGKYAGQMGLHDFSHRGGGATLVVTGREPLGDDFFRGLVEQDLRLYGRAQELDAAVARGERAIAIPSRSRMPLEYAGAQVAWIAPEDGIYFVAMQSGIVNRAPHPNAAHLFINFLLSEDAQSAFAEAGDAPVITGVAGVVNLEETPLLGSGGTLPELTPRLNEFHEFAQSLLNR
jgi:iron(III) transport system substrate-binding protein